MERPPWWKKIKQKKTKKGGLGTDQGRADWDMGREGTRSGQQAVHSGLGADISRILALGAD